MGLEDRPSLFQAANYGFKLIALLLIALLVLRLHYPSCLISIQTSLDCFFFLFLKEQWNSLDPQSETGKR